MLRFLTAGETHGKGLIAVVDGIPAGLKFDIELINSRLALRQKGYGRGGRMQIESDKAEVMSGVRDGKTMGSPVAIFIKNKDWENWSSEMDAFCASYDRKVTKPRPGHADLTGAIKYNHEDIRNVLERASARETAIRTAVGAMCAGFLEQFGIRAYSYVKQIGKVTDDTNYLNISESEIADIISKSEMRCLNPEAESKMIEYIKECKENGDTAGGIFEVVVKGVPAGLGSYIQWDRKIDGNIAKGLVSLQAIKAVEFGIGTNCALESGSKVHDPIVYDEGFKRTTNNAGGIEGGMTNGEDIVVRAAMKPIPTLYKPINSVDIGTKEPFKASIERSDVCAVPAASVVGESIVMFEIANAFFDKFGGDNFKEISNNYEAYKDYCSKF